MTSFLRAALWLAVVLSAASAGAGPVEGRLEINRGHAEIVRYADAPGAVILGDASVAVANLTASGVLVLTARGNGVTNVIVLSPEGAEVDRFLVSVPITGDSVSVRRAMARETLLCDPGCRAFGDRRPPRAEPDSGDPPTGSDVGPPATGEEIAAVTN